MLLSVMPSGIQRRGRAWRACGFGDGVASAGCRKMRVRQLAVELGGGNWDGARGGRWDGMTLFQEQARQREVVQVAGKLSRLR